MMRVVFRVPLLMLALGLTPAMASGADIASPPDGPRWVVVVGAPGTPEYGEQFADWANRWQQLAERVQTPVVRIGQPPPAETHTTDHTETNTDAEDVLSDKQRLRDTLESIPADSVHPFWLVLIGHGTSLRQESKFNLRGPDVSADELAAWLERLDRPTVIVNNASSSGPFVTALSGENRVVVTATRSGTEQNATLFGDYFSRAIGSPASDLDHDESVSVLEAFAKATAEVRQAYEAQDRILTEHALIDDNGDQQGTPASAYRGIEVVGEIEGEGSIDGRRAAGVTIPLSDPPLPWTAEQIRRRDALERQLQDVRGRRSQLSDEAFERELEAILVPLARLYAEVESAASDPTRSESRDEKGG